VQASDSSRFRAVLFDLDGTLIDHFRIIYRSYSFAVNQLGVPAASFDKLKASVGGAVNITFGKLMPAEHVEPAVALFREEFDRIWHEDIEVLPGVEWLLQGLHDRGCQLAVFTNKEGDRARRILAHLGLDRRLDATFGTLDTPWRKPMPEFTRHVLQQLNADPAHACMIGDSPYDVAAASAADIPCFAVATGSHSVEELRNDSDAAEVFSDLFSLGSTVFGLQPPPAANA
jgi:phosphoglycolate phosphatase